MTGVFRTYRIEPATIPASAHFTVDGGINFGGELASYVFAEAGEGVFLTVRVRRRPMSFKLTDAAEKPLRETPSDAYDLGAEIAAHVAEHVQETGKLPTSIIYQAETRPAKRRSNAA